ncbi:hypothetical protein EQG49_11210 [Periweissella cryptocerci]|uniref:Bacteriophage Gp15 protein n=1 Tax=Periweissella cryptocerci TaxID=2506420 RepID=A0A4V1AIX0_9LACO|nr:Gp15 family bacteriophage protein [Periweissella cryptocerci]QBO36975.1 hypothetical protein EQG49_11210 [Periweissella cryptocerci]
MLFSLSHSLDDSFEYEGVSGKVDMSFDNVILMFETQTREDMDAYLKLIVSLQLLVGDDYEERGQDFQVGLYQYLMDEYINDNKPIIDPDALRNGGGGKEDAEQYSLTEDAEYIFASFLQAYGMDLHDQFKKLHWYKFRALLAGLPDDTKFRQVLQIRQWKPYKGVTKEEKQQMQDLQVVYRLHVTQAEAEFARMTPEERDIYMEEHPELFEPPEDDEPYL